ncbi:small G protein signaling modulator 3 [Sarotherodon galilaeus]
MMETKLWIALCALLVIHLGSAVHGDGDAPAPSSKTSPNTVQTTGAPVLANMSTLGLDTANHLGSSSATNISSNGTDSVSSSTTTENTSIPITAEPRKDNVTDNAMKTAIAKNENTTTKALSPSQSNPTAAVPTNTSTTHVLHTSAGAPVTPTPSSNQNASEHPSQTKDPRATTSEPPKPESNTTAATNTKSVTAPSNTSSQNPSTSQPQTNTLQSDRQSTAAQPSSQTSSHANNPSQLNVDGDGMAHNSPGLDPLLAGLVSAFIIAAVIITLLLFLKLRRRGNRPEFRRLQDLPMDDMEDTPLSMYSY